MTLTTEKRKRAKPKPISDVASLRRSCYSFCSICTFAYSIDFYMPSTTTIKCVVDMKVCGWGVFFGERENDSTAFISFEHVFQAFFFFFFEELSRCWSSRQDAWEVLLGNNDQSCQTAQNITCRLKHLKSKTFSLNKTLKGEFATLLVESKKSILC